MVADVVNDENDDNVDWRATATMAAVASTTL